MRHILAFTLLVTTAAAAGPALAQTPLGLNQSVWLQVQAFRPDIRSTARLDHPRSGAEGTEVGFEDVLGMPRRKTLGAFLVGGRFGSTGNWRAEFEVYRLNRSATQTIGTSIRIDDTVFPVSASISSEFDTNVYRAGLGYSFLRTPSAEAGVTFGLHVTDFKVALEGQGSVDGVPLTMLRREERSTTVPLPTLGLYTTVALSNNWTLDARGDLLYLEVRQSKGALLNLSGNVSYRITPNVSVGLGYRYVDYRLERTRDDERGRVDYRFRGPQMFVGVGF